jgi:hypothetical protein
MLGASRAGSPTAEHTTPQGGRATSYSGTAKRAPAPFLRVSMVRVAYLSPGETPPPGERFVLIECIPGYDWTNSVERETGLTHQIGPDDLELLLPVFQARAERDGYEMIFISGAGQPCE